MKDLSLAELEMLPEWAGRKAAAGPSLVVDPDETAPVPAGEDVDTLENEIVQGDPGGLIITDPDETVDDTPDDGADQAVDTSPDKGLPQVATTAEPPKPRRTAPLLVVMALLALAAGIAAGYVYLMVAG